MALCTWLSIWDTLQWQLQFLHSIFFACLFPKLDCLIKLLDLKQCMFELQLNWSWTISYSEPVDVGEQFEIVTVSLYLYLFSSWAVYLKKDNNIFERNNLQNRDSRGGKNMWLWSLKMTKIFWKNWKCKNLRYCTSNMF